MLDAQAAQREANPFPLLWEEYLLKRHKARKRLRKHVISMVERPRPGGRFSPSSIGGCHREAVFKFLGVEGKNKFNPDMEQIFEDGNWRHHKWQALFKDMERVLGKKRFRLVGIEFPTVIEGLLLAGHLDAHVIMNGVHYIIDIKGINSFGFKKVCVDQIAPMEAHVWQLIAYMKAMDVRRGLVLYENKERNEIKSFVVHYEKETWTKVTDWLDQAINYTERKQLPPRHPGCVAGQFAYRRCMFKHLCYGIKWEDNERLRSMVYKGFKSVEVSWQRGLEAFEEAQRRAA